MSPRLQASPPFMLFFVVSTITYRGRICTQCRPKALYFVFCFEDESAYRVLPDPISHFRILSFQKKKAYRVKKVKKKKVNKKW